MTSKQFVINLVKTSITGVPVVEVGELVLIGVVTKVGLQSQ